MAQKPSDGIVSDIFGDQIEVNGQWFHAERIFGKAANTFSIGDHLESLAEKQCLAKHEAPDELVTSDLFRESGANLHSEQKIEHYADCMRSYGGWGDFPPIAARIITITVEDVEKYQEYELQGWAHELTYSRPLTYDDVGKRIAHIENGHHRAYAAARVGVELAVYDLALQDQLCEESCRQSSAIG